MEKSNVMSVSKDDCCGCSACSAICPTDAISMELDQHGFYYPSVNENRCVGCELCLQVCGMR